MQPLQSAPQLETTPAPCRCEDSFVALVAQLETIAERAGFRLQYLGAVHVVCGKQRASSTSRRRMAVLLERRRIVSAEGGAGEQAECREGIAA